MTASHDLRVVINGAQIGDWESYHVDSSLITMADAFTLRRPFDAQMWNLLRRDSDVSITIDGTTILRGFIDKRRKDSKAGQMTISGRDRSGRVVDESAPRVDYTGMSIQAAVLDLVRPWFDRVTLSDARNRLLRRGRGKRLAGGAEPVVDITIRVPRRGFVHPGMSRAQVIKEIAARASCIAYSSADGREFFIGRPNQAQPAQYEFVNAAPAIRRPGTEYVLDLIIEEDDGDRYSLIMCAGAGGQSDTNYGKNVTDNVGVVFDNPFDKRDRTTRDGTGRDFIHPKRLFMPEKDFESYGDAQRVARNEQVKRDMKRHTVTIMAPLHGQFLDAGPATLFAPGCVAHVVDEDQDPHLDDNYLLLSCSYTSQRDQGETTTMHMVPTGTEILI